MYFIIGADGQEYGPIGVDQLRDWLAEGRVNAQTRVRPEGLADWKPLAQFPELASLLGAAAPKAPNPPTISPLAAPTGQARQTHPMAIAGLVLGILSLLLVCCCYGFPLNLVGIVLSVIALSEIKRQPQRYDGSALATIGLILCVLTLLLAVALLVVGLTTHNFYGLHRFRHL
jgi:uncharacterized membrane protein YiaA